MVAGMVLAFAKGQALPDVLRYGIAAGTAATMNPGTALCIKEDVEKLYKCLKEKKL
jgi:6-phosphofructokinase 2